MTHFHKLRTQSILKWVSFNLIENAFIYSKISYTVQNPRFYSTRKAIAEQNYIREEAKTAFFDYLHATRSHQFLDAEFMSRNSPIFLENLLKKVENEPEIGRALIRFLRYHPINEFEPFFESIGLKPHEFEPFLPRDLIFLSDDRKLMENYHVLCNYGIARNKIGKIYKEASEVFGYDHGVLESKLQSFETLGLNKSSVIRVVASSPCLLIENFSNEFCQFRKIVEKLKSSGVDYDCMANHLIEEESYDWNLILDFFCLFGKVGISDEQIGKIILRNPRLLLESSGATTFSVIAFLLKFGSNFNEIISGFLQCPKIQVTKFFSNLRKNYYFLVELKMPVEDIGSIVRSHPSILGACSLKKVNSVLTDLNIGKKRACRMVKENPEILKNWVFGKGLKPLPNTGEKEKSLEMKRKFIMDMGFEENSREMEKAIKVFRGKGMELQERFEFFVNLGLERNDVYRMLKVAPQVINQSIDVIKSKVNFLISDLGFPISTLVAFPAYANYTIERVKLRFSMYVWLRDNGKADPNLSLSTIIAISEARFVQVYVKRHPEGPRIWEKLKKEIHV